MPAAAERMRLGGMRRQGGKQSFELGELHRRLAAAHRADQSRQRAERDLLRRRCERLACRSVRSPPRSSRCCAARKSRAASSSASRARRKRRAESASASGVSPSSAERVARCPAPARARSADRALLGSQTKRDACRSSVATRRAFGTSSSGRSTAIPAHAPRSGIAARPSRPLPRLSRIRKVSAWSSRVMRGDERRNVVRVAIGGHQIVARGARPRLKARAAGARRSSQVEDRMRQAERRGHAARPSPPPRARLARSRDRPSAR